MNGLSDQELIRLANCGNKKSMTTLYLRYRDWVSGMARRFVGNDHDALDVTQEVFIYLFGKFPGFELRCQMKTFLYPVIRHIAINHAIKNKRYVPLQDQHSADDLENPDSKTEIGSALRFAEIISTLAPEERDIIILRFADEHTLPEISDILNLPLGTVKSRLHRILQKLRERLRANFK